jgi:predicted NAD/FAD-dependent oxidoreductase
MNALPKTLPAAQHVQAQKKVIQLSYETNNTASGPGTWIALSEDGSSSYARNLVSTIPVPQLLALLNQSHLPQASLGQTMAIKKLQSLAYHPCISLMIILSKTPHSPDSVTRHPSPEIDCIVNNTNKGISPHTPCVTIFASASWSRAHFADSDEAVFKHLWSLCRSDTQAEPVEHQIHRWRYSTPETHCPESFLELPLIEDRHAPPLLIGGDAFGRDDLTPFERAILSGEAIARHLQKAK